MSEELENLRSEIDAIDSEIVENLNRRARVVKKIGEIKRKNDMQLYAPGREREVIDRLVRLGGEEFPAASLKQIYREIIATCLNLEKPVRVAYLGPEATFTHSAALDKFGRSSELAAYDSVSRVFDAVERGDANFGLVPVESSREGAVRHTLDRFIESNLSICSETYLMINLYLLSNEEKLEDVEIVYSHRQAIEQASSWLEEKMPGAEVKRVNSTAEAASIAAEDKKTAAVAAEAAADLYDLDVLARQIENRPDNYTRFLVIGDQIPEPTGDDKTSIAFSVQDRAGALYEMLEPFGRRGINMTKIESRPSKSKTWDYIFFVDFMGHRDDETITELLSGLKSRSPFFKILGSYPREEPFDER
ncbi:MAG: prephenate dehydratase [bacterium]